MKYALVMMLVFAGVACAADPIAVVLGKWAAVTGKDRIEFKADATYAANMTYGREQVLSEFSGMFGVNNDTIMLTMSVDSAIPAMLWKFKITSDRLFITYEDGGPAKFNHTKAEFKRAK